jgi:UDP-N-acetylglucosamine acyltransferase
MTKIHSTAIISPGAQIHESVEVGPYVCIGASVKIAQGSSIGSHTVIDGDTTIGQNCKIFPHVSVGLAPQDLSYTNEDTKTIIGNNVTLREFCSVHRATTKDKGITSIGDNCYLMNYVHVGHDCELHNDVIIANAVNLGGHVVVEQKVNIGGGCFIHQHVRIGEFVMMAGMTASQKSVPPFCLAFGAPAKFMRVNSVGLNRAGLAKEEIQEISLAYKLIKKEGVRSGIEQLEAKAQLFHSVKKIVDFYKQADKGVITFHRQDTSEA